MAITTRTGRRRWLYPAALLTALISPLHADAPPPQITWIVPDYPPGYITEGPQAGQGQGDRVLAWFRRELPEYRHQVRTESMARAMSLLGSTLGDYCIAGFPRFDYIADHTVAASAIAVVPPLRLITLQDTLSRLPLDGGRLSLADLLAREDLNVAILEGRHYLDLAPLLGDRQAGTNVLVVSPGRMVGSLFGLLFSGRVDYLIDHSFMLPYVRSLEPDRGMALASVALVEAREEVVLHPQCRDNRLGREVVERLESIIKAPDFRAMMVESFVDLFPVEEQEQVRRLQGQAFLKAVSAHK
jgi:uncharacterized protein (TIGR02285 family)